MPEPFQIFISHRMEDRILARALKKQIEFLSRRAEKRIICHVCQDIPGGADWRKWIIDNTQKSNLLLFLYTGVDHNWMWCTAEISQFDGYWRAKGSAPTIAWFALEQSSTFPMLEPFQYYGIDQDSVRRFFKELFEGPLCGPDSLFPGIEVERSEEFDNAVAEVKALFHGLSRPEELFRLRLKIVFGNDDDFRSKIAEGVKFGCRERAKQFMKTARYEGDSSTVHFLQGAGSEKLSWDGLLDAQRKRRNTYWLEELENYVSSSFSDADIQKKNSREQVLSSIFYDFKLYQPVIAKLEYIENTPFSVVIIFVPMPLGSDDPRIMMSQGVPKEVVYVSILNRLARRFRWGFLEPLYNLVDNGDEQFGDEAWVNFIERYDDCITILNSIDQQGDYDEFASISDLQNSTGYKNRNLLVQMFGEYKKLRQSLSAAVESRSPVAIEKVLNPWMKINKDFMISLSDLSNEQIMILRPK